MKKIFYLGCLLSLAFVLVACSQKTVIGDHDIVAQERPVGQFTRIKAEGAFSLTIAASQSQQRVSVTADKNLQAYILTEVKGQTLKVLTKRGFILSPAGPIQVQINVSKLDKLVTTDATQVNVTSVDSPSFELVSTGNTHFTLTGKVNLATYEMFGAIQLNAKNLLAEQVNLKINGTSSADVFASKLMNLRIYDTSSVTYYGTPPIVNQAIFGAGKLKRVY